MKTKKRTLFVKLSSKIVALVCIPNLAMTAPETFLEGFYFDSPNSYMLPWLSASGGTFRNNIDLNANFGGLTFYSGLDETNKGDRDGGITLYASPISMVLGSSNNINPDASSFNVWTSTAWGTVSALPLFQIDGSTGNSTYSGSNVRIDNGTLSVSGTITSANSPVLTSSSLSAALNSAVPPTSTAWKNAYVPKNSTATGALALGSSQATGVHSFASGTAQATGGYSSAHGASTTASGSYSLARGFNANATGNYSLAMGPYARASGHASTAFGEISHAQGNYSFTQGIKVAANSMNEVVLGRAAQSGASNTNFWHDHDALFRLGNGDLSASYLGYYYGNSDALTVLKSGHTTVGNKYWRSAVAQDANAALANPPSLTDHDGEALVVDGHTRLRGKVVIEQAQGDISMGIYCGDSSQTPDPVIHGVIPLSFSGSGGSGSIQIDGRTISVFGIGFQNGGLDNGWFEENGTEIDPYYSGEPAVLSDGKRLTITAIGEGGIGVAILPPL